MLSGLDDALSALSSVDLRQVWARHRLSAGARLKLYGKIASLSRTGMPLPKALDAVWRVASAGGRRAGSAEALAIDSWRRRVYDGYSFGQALAGWVPDRETTIMEAGAGDLSRALDEAAGLIRSSKAMKSAVLTAVGYPVFLSGLLAFLLWIFSADAIPAFAEVKPMERWTGLAASMGVLSNTVRAGLVPFVAAVLALAAVCVWSLPRWTGRWRTRFEVLPPWSFYRIIMGTAFMTALVALLRAGMPIPEALRRLRGKANPWLGERIDAALFFVNSGYDLGEALHLAGHGFPAPEIVEDLRVYATLGNLDESLSRISAEWVDQSLASMRAAGDALRVVGMALVAATIAWVQLGIIAVQQQLSGGF